MINFLLPAVSSSSLGDTSFFYMRGSRTRHFYMISFNRCISAGIVSLFTCMFFFQLGHNIFKLGFEEIQEISCLFQI